MNVMGGSEGKALCTKMENGNWAVKINDTKIVLKVSKKSMDRIEVASSIHREALKRLAKLKKRKVSYDACKGR